MPVGQDSDARSGSADTEQGHAVSRRSSQERVESQASRSTSVRNLIRQMEQSRTEKVRSPMAPVVEEYDLTEQDSDRDDVEV